MVFTHYCVAHKKTIPEERQSIVVNLFYYLQVKLSKEAGKIMISKSVAQKKRFIPALHTKQLKWDSKHRFTKYLSFKTMPAFPIKWTPWFCYLPFSHWNNQLKKKKSKYWNQTLSYPQLLNKVTKIFCILEKPVIWLSPHMLQILPIERRLCKIQGLLQVGLTILGGFWHNILITELSKHHL